jgi:hypothetical protein
MAVRMELPVFQILMNFLHFELLSLIIDKTKSYLLVASHIVFVCVFKGKKQIFKSIQILILSYLSEIK